MKKKQSGGGEMPNRCQPQVGFWVTTRSTAVLTEQHHRMTLKPTALKKAQSLFKLVQKNVTDELRGKSVADWQVAGVGESVYGVCESVAGRKGGPRAPH